MRAVVVALLTIAALVAIEIAPSMAEDEARSTSAATMTTVDGTVVYCVTQLVGTTRDTTYGSGLVDCPAQYTWTVPDRETTKTP